MPGKISSPPASLHDGYRDLINELNQRYRREFDRARRLEAELADLKGSRAFRLFFWLRRLRRRFFPIPSAPTSAPPPQFEVLPLLPVSPRGRVSIIIPFKDRLELLKSCLHSLRQTSYGNFEVVLVDNGSREIKTRHFLRRLREKGRRVVSCPGPFNFSRLANRGARGARGDFLLFLNNDTQVITPDWLEHMLTARLQPGIGLVGATLLYLDGTIQHAGIFPDEAGNWQHACRGQPFQPEHFPGVTLVPALTGACLLIGKALFWELNGFDERLPVTHNDIDLCTRARDRGWKAALTPDARLWHFESISRGYGDG